MIDDHNMFVLSFAAYSIKQPIIILFLPGLIQILW